MRKLLKFQLNILKKTFLPTVLFSILILGLFIAYQAIFQDKFFPVTYIGDTNVTFLTKAQAAQVLTNKFNFRTTQKLEFTYQDKTYTVDLANSQATLSYQDVINQAFFVGRTGTYFKQLQDQFQIFFNQTDFNPSVNLDLTAELDEMAKQIDQPAKNAIISLDETGEVTILSSETGLALNKDLLKKQVSDYFLFGNTSLVLPIEVNQPAFDTQRAEEGKQLLKNLQQAPITLKYEDKSWEFTPEELLPLFNLETKDALVDPKKLEEYIKTIASEIDQPVLEPLFKFDGTKVNEFRAAQDGLEVNIPQTSSGLLAALNTNSKEVIIATQVAKPKNQIEEINKLGIKDLLGRGVSHFAGSIINRDFNVKLTASRLNGVLVPAGEEFSFLRTVGDITTATGFKQAYIIQNGRTVLGDGGGVCQDSTTLFRAALNAGLPITQRTAHAYRVTYYEQGGFGPGLDATVYYPSVDFRFKNDTSSYILIQAYTEGTTLYIDLYGTSDGRKAEVTRPVILSQTPPLPEIRQDDPTLPRGTVKQVDWAAWGARTSFKRTVTRDGEVIADENWISNFKPWQAVYLVGTREN